MSVLPRLVLMALLSGCGVEGALCGEGLDPVVVTGLNGTIDGEPSVEILYRVPDTCEAVDRGWMFFDDETETMRFGEEPTEGTLMRGEVDAGDSDRTIFFRDTGVGVRLVYPGDEEASTVDFVWFASGIDLARGTCAGDGASLSCAAATP